MWPTGRSHNYNYVTYNLSLCYMLIGEALARNSKRLQLAFEWGRSVCLVDRMSHNGMARRNTWNVM
jgi:hypothetical protein